MHVVLQDVEDPRHLGEDEDSVALFLELFEKLVEENDNMMDKKVDKKVASSTPTVKRQRK